MADHLVQPPHHSDSRKIGIWVAILLLGPITAVVLLATETRVLEGFEPVVKSANLRLSQAFEDIKDTAPVSGDLKSALASLSQRVQGERKPPVRANGK